MQRLQEEIEDFTTFAREKLLEGANISLDEIYDQWREAHPSAEDALAVQASLRDMEQGETGRLFAEFATDFTTRNKISDEQ